MVKMKVPGIDIMNSARDNIEVVVLARNKKIRLLYSSSHNVLVLFVSDILVTIAAEHVLKVISFGFATF